MNFPVLTAYQTLETAQGTLDPLGLYTIADRLALRLAPGLRERMKHPRYLTAIAVGSVICSDFDEDELAKDEVSPPWQVYEWHITSALVKKFEKADPDQLLGMPSREKTTKAFRDGVGLSANRYLKTPSVYGFHGVYRTFAKEIKLIDGNEINEFGQQLVNVWENEQGLRGFSTRITDSPGRLFRSKLVEAVRKGLSAGQVDVSWTWNFYEKIADSLAPKSPGAQESTILFNALVNESSPYRAELISFLMSPEGVRATDEDSEKIVHTEFLNHAVHCKPLLLAIQVYEKIARLMHNAFYEILHYMHQHQSRGNLDKFTKLSWVEKAWKELPILFEQGDKALEPFGEEAKLFSNNFQLLRERLAIKEWLAILFEHHFKVQKSKPPNGKAPWLLEVGPDNFLLNTTMGQDIDLSEEYVHQYRTYSIRSFLTDLRKIES